MAAAAWTRTRVTEVLGCALPVVQAPMAGWTPPELVAAVCEAGGLGSLGAARMAPEQLHHEIQRIKLLTDRPFAVNLFAPLPPDPPRKDVVHRVRHVVAAQHKALGIPGDGPKELTPPPFTYADQLAVILDEHVPVFSFTFGIPPGLDDVRATGARIVGTATTAGEAVALEEAGVDAIALQGTEAGGHRGTFACEPEHGLIGLMALVPQAAAHVSTPLIAAGGIVDGHGLAAALALGAGAAQVGSAFLLTDESGAPEAYRAELPGTPDTATVVTRALTGRHARLVGGPLVDTLEEHDAIAPFGVQNQLLGELIAEGSRRRERARMLLFAGQAAGLARAMPAARLVETLVAEADETLSRLTGG